MPENYSHKWQKDWLSNTKSPSYTKLVPPEDQMFMLMCSNIGFACVLCVVMCFKLINCSLRIESYWMKPY